MIMSILLVITRARKFVNREISWRFIDAFDGTDMCELIAASSTIFLHKMLWKYQKLIYINPVSYLKSSRFVKIVTRWNFPWRKRHFVATTSKQYSYTTATKHRFHYGFIVIIHITQIRAIDSMCEIPNGSNWMIFLYLKYLYISLLIG